MQNTKQVIIINTAAREHKGISTGINAWPQPGLPHPMLAVNNSRFSIAGGSALKLPSTIVACLYLPCNKLYKAKEASDNSFNKNVPLAYTVACDWVWKWE